jgi:hypothetical protein
MRPLPDERHEDEESTEGSGQGGLHTNRKDRRARRLKAMPSKDARPHQEADPMLWKTGSGWGPRHGPMTGALHRRVLQVDREADLLQGRFLERSCQALQPSLDGNVRAPSTFTMVRRLTRMRSRRSSARPSLSILLAKETHEASEHSGGPLTCSATRVGPVSDLSPSRPRPASDIGGQ